MQHRNSAERRLALQLAVTRVLMDAVSLEDAVPRLLRDICLAEGWKLGILWRTDEAAQVMRCHSTWAVAGEASDFIKLTRRYSFARGEGRLGEVWLTGQSYCTADVAADACHRRGKAARAAGLHASWALPVVGGDVRGVLEFYDAEVIEEDDTMRELLGSIGRQIGLLVERVEARDERRRTQAMLQSSERLASLGTLAAGVAHEVNNPLTYVRLNLGRLISMESAREKDPERLHRLELLQESREGVDRAAHILSDLKLLARPPSEEREPVELWTALELALEMTAHEIRHRARLVRVHGDAPAVLGDTSRVAQVFVALLLNAAQAIPEGDANANTIRVETSTDAQGRAMVTIVDTGCGMSEEMARCAFEPFFSTKGTNGTGLGLWISRGVVEQLGGEISVTSRPGRGSIFHVAFPACDELPRSARPAEPARSSGDGPARVLIVDDERAVAAAVAASLGDDYEVSVAGSGREALEILRHEDAFDAVICDLIMGDITGMEVYEALRLVAPRLARRMIFMTAGAFTETAARFVERIPNLKLDKPFSADELKRQIGRQLARNEEEKAERASGRRSAPSAASVGPW